MLFLVSWMMCLLHLLISHAADWGHAMGERSPGDPPLSVYTAMQPWPKKEVTEGHSLLLDLWALRRLPVPVRWDDMPALPLWPTAQWKPDWLPGYPHHQTGVAFPLGRHPCISSNVGDYRHHLCHGHFHPIQWHAHSPGIWEGTQLCSVDGHLSLLHHHFPDDSQTWCGSMFFPASFLGLGDVHQLCSPLDKNQSDLSHIWAGQEISDSSQTHKPNIAAGNHFHFNISSASRCFYLVWHRPTQHHRRLWWT